MNMGRITKQYIDLQNKPPLHISAGPVDTSNMLEWTASIQGPEGTPYEGGTFFLSIILPPNYPFKNPKAIFTTKIYHPNVSAIGEISANPCLFCDSCLEWTPTWTISKSLVFVRQLLIQPDTFKCCSTDIAKIYQESRPLYNLKAKEWTQKYAT